MTDYAESKTRLTKIIPQLRRYARLLCGEQELGDGLAAEALASLVSRAEADPGRDARIGAYEEVTHLYRSRVGQGVAAKCTIGPEKHLAALPDESRQAFLLVAMEEFSPADAAQILGMSEPEFAAHLHAGRRKLASEIACDVLIIEDELFIATDIERAVVSLGHRVVALERTRAAAQRAALELRPSLILADVKLADDSSGIDAVNDILQHFQVPVVFITAYPERLLTGLRPEPTYLIAKPFSQEALRAVITQALLLDRRARPPEDGQGARLA